MPILMVALIALAVFGIIGVMLLAAMLLEHRTSHRHADAAQVPAQVLPLAKH